LGILLYHVSPVEDLFSPLPSRKRPARPKTRPGEGDLGSTRGLDSCLRRNDILGPFIRLKYYGNF